MTRGSGGLASRTDPRAAPWPRLPRGERGVGLVEVIVATVIATIAVIALAYSFGTGRELVNRYELARMALAAAQRRMEWLSVRPAGDPALDSTPHGPLDVLVDGRAVLEESWTVAGFDDPATSPAPGAPDLKKVTVTVTWGRGTAAETVQLTRLFAAR